METFKEIASCTTVGELRHALLGFDDNAFVEMGFGEPVQLMLGEHKKNNKPVIMFQEGESEDDEWDGSGDDWDDDDESEAA